MIEKEGDLLDAKEKLESQGIKPTIVRLKVLDYLQKLKNHPTADTIHQALVKEIPTLSKTSVYNTTRLLLCKNLIRPVTIEENEVRYDADTSDHGHFKCTQCGEVYDFQADFSEWTFGLSKNFLIQEKQILFKGICKNCL